MALQAGSVSVGLGYTLDDRQLKAYQHQLDRVEKRAKDKDAFKARLGASYDERAYRAYQRDLDRAERANKDMVRSQGRLRTSFGSVWSKGGAAFAAAGGAYAVVTAVKSITKAYGESEVSQGKLKAQLKALGISYKEHRGEIDEVIQKHSQLSGLDDEDLQDAFTNIIRVTGNVDKSLRLTGLAADFARAKHMDVAKAGEIVGKVAGGNTGILSRYGIQIDKGATATEALGKLQDKFKGQAEAYGKTQAGSQDRVRVAFENLQETLGKRFGPTITRYANKLADFINQMSSGEGAGGRFANGLDRIGKVASGAAKLFGGFARAVRVGFILVLDVLDKAYGAVSTLFRALSHVPGMGWAKKVADDIDTSREKIRDFKKEMNLGVAARDVEKDLDRMAKKGGTSLSDIRKDAAREMRRIKTRLGTDSKEGKDALARNFDIAVDRIKDAMRRGRISTATGLRQIRILMFDELKTLGIDSAQAKGKPLTQDPAKANRAQRYMGGWLGGRGLVGQDTIPAMLAPGEAVLNRHQQAVIEGMLGDGFLDRLFAQVNRPHFMQKGGRIPFAAGGLAPAVSTLANQLVKQFGLSITSTTGGNHAPNSYHYRGLAADLGGAPVAMHRASEWIKSSGAYKSLLEGIHNPNLAVKNGAMVSPSFYSGVWAGHANHIHIALRALGAIVGGAAGAGGGDAMWENIKAPRTTMTGALGDIVQGTLTRTTAAANRRGRSLAASLGGGDITGQGLTTAGGQYSKAQLAALWRRAGGPARVANTMAAIALAESRGDPNAHNPSGATGLWQILGNPFPGNARDPLTNARMAVAKWRERGFQPWEAYTNGNYKQFMQRGGFARFEGGGVVPGLGEFGRYNGRDANRRVTLYIPGVGAYYVKKWQVVDMRGRRDPRRERAMRLAIMRQRQHPEWPGQPGVQLNSMGGFIQRFNGGGIARFARGKPGRRGGGLQGYQGGPAAGGGGTRLTIKGLRGIQGDRIENLEDIEANVEDMREDYTRQDRRYSLSDEILIDEETGAVNERNVKKRANELLKLLAIRAHILQQLRKMRTILRRVVQTYRTIIRRLTRSLRHAKKKERSGIRKQIAHYRTQLSNRQGQLKDLRGDIFDAETDVMEIRAERKEVLGTTAEVRTPDDIASDLSDAGGDVGDAGGDTGTDATEAPPTPLQIAEAAAAEMRTFLAGRQELLTSFGRNFVPTSQAGATFGTPDALTSAAGLRAFGGAGTAGGLGGATVIAHFASSPENAPTFVEQVRFLVGG